MRIALGIEYDGSAYCGWQTQDGVTTIQPLVEAALGAVAAHAVSVQCAGRTDSGVHATYQVAHFDTDASRPARAWVLGANTHLPVNIAVTWARAVPAHFNARYSATARAYQYLIANRHPRAGLWHGRVGWEYHPLDVDAMRQAAVALLGRHDFSSFRGQGCQSRHPVRHLTQLDIAEQRGLLVFRVGANAFLLHMVRNIVGTLLEVGRGRREPAWVASVLAARDRRCAGMTAPAQGLYLTAVDYPTEFALPAPPRDALHLTAFSGVSYDG